MHPEKFILLVIRSSITQNRNNNEVEETVIESTDF